MEAAQDRLFAGGVNNPMPLVQDIGEQLHYFVLGVLCSVAADRPSFARRDGDLRYELSPPRIRARLVPQLSDVPCPRAECRGRDSNPYALVGPRILSPPRLPFRHPGWRAGVYVGYRLGSAARGTFTKRSSTTSASTMLI